MTTTNLLDAILIAAGGIDLAFFSLLFLGWVITWANRLLNPPPPPYCDIDPRNHAAFVRAPDGTYWIGNVKVPA